MYQLNYRLGTQHWSEYADLAQAGSMRASRGMRLSARIFDAVLAGSLAGAGLYAAHLFFKLDDSLALAMLAAFVVFYSLGVLVSQRHLKTIAPAFPRRDGTILGERSAIISEDFVEITGDLVHTRYEWRAFERVERLQRMIILWTEPGAGVVLPRTAFQSDGEYVGFAEFATECLNAPRATKKAKAAPAMKIDAKPDMKSATPVAGAAE